jgi:hypothetical protein
VVLFFVFNLSKLSLTHLSASLYPWNSSIRLYTTKSSEPIWFTILLIPVSFWMPDTYRVSLLTESIDSSKQFQVFHVNSSFFTVLFTGKVQFGRESPILQALGTVFCVLWLQDRPSRLAIAYIPFLQAFCCRPKSLLKCLNISPIYILFSYISTRLYSIWYCASLYKIDSRVDSRVSRLRNFLLTGTLPYTGFTFDSPERQSYIYI